jgi:hypothetical protein
MDNWNKLHVTVVTRPGASHSWRNENGESGWSNDFRGHNGVYFVAPAGGNVLRPIEGGWGFTKQKDRTPKIGDVVSVRGCAIVRNHGNYRSFGRTPGRAARKLARKYAGKWQGV